MLLASDTHLNQQSYYEASVTRAPIREALRGDVQADVVVIGAGYAGLSAALELAQRGYSVVVLEAGRIGQGASGRNGGQTIVGYACGQAVFERQLGMADAKHAWQMSLEAIRLIDERIATYKIDCDRVHGYLYVADSPRKARALAADMRESLDKYGFVCDFVTGTDVRKFIDSPRYYAAAYDTVSGHLHPLKYCLGIAKACAGTGIHIHEYSRVTTLERGATVVARTAQGSVRAKFAVLAGNVYLPELGDALAPEISGRIMPVGTYIAATEPLKLTQCRELIPSNAAVCDNNFVLDYFRFSADHRLLFGGRVSYTTLTPPNLMATMHARMLRVFPQLQGVEMQSLWGGFVDITQNRAPDFGRIGSNVYYLQGFSGHGVALTQLAGRLVAEAVAGHAERFDVFARLRHHRFIGGKWLRMPSLALAMLFFQLRDFL
jgi:gamma-glutamylputrescine oxidase